MDVYVVQKTKRELITVTKINIKTNSSNRKSFLQSSFIYVDNYHNMGTCKTNDVRRN